MRKILFAAVLTAFASTAYAQSGTTSPYSQYGFGDLADPSTGFNRGMNGVGIAFRGSNQVNPLNPASYSAVDSLTFIFDVGMSGQITNFKEGAYRRNGKSATFEYATAMFRAFKHVGVSFGLIPYSRIGYNYSSSDKISTNATTTYTNTYQGTGGLNQAYLGIGWEPIKGFSLGANVAYLWGNLNRSVSNTYSDSYANTLTKYYSASVSSVKMNAGAQGRFHIGKQQFITFGATYAPKLNIGGNPTCQIISTNTQTALSDTLSFRAIGGLETPAVIGAGMQWEQTDKFKIGADYILEQWSQINYPQYIVNNDKGNYTMLKGLFNDRHKLTLGAEYLPNIMSRNFFQRIRYRVGVSYATSYLKINDQNGPRELSVSGGFGIPIRNGYNNRSLLNISAQWVKRGSSTFVTENTFRINVGITFNERWFEKWKVQ